jgi:hypothetical protein
MLAVRRRGKVEEAGGTHLVYARQFGQAVQTKMREETRRRHPEERAAGSRAPALGAHPVVGRVIPAQAGGISPASADCAARLGKKSVVSWIGALRPSRRPLSRPPQDEELSQCHQSLILVLRACESFDFRSKVYHIWWAIPRPDYYLL